MIAEYVPPVEGHERLAATRDLNSRLTGIIFGKEDDVLLSLYHNLRFIIEAHAASPDERKLWYAVSRRMEMLTGGAEMELLKEALRGSLNGWTP